MIGEIARKRRRDGVGPEKKHADDPYLDIRDAQILAQGRNDRG
jgi:hypothetical protein